MQSAATLLRSAAMTERSLLRILACGSVDDGKSSLLGRLLAETGAIASDQLAELEADSRRFGTQGGAVDYALLLDGLSAEREQGITIDVAWRYFGTARRSFIVADAPGHEQYTRNMATAASTADLALLLVDATKGLLTQTRRHATIAALMGVRAIVLAVNKMDRAGYDRATFDAIVADFAGYAAGIGLPAFTAIPVSATGGDNVAARSAAMPWYEGPTVLEHLERVDAPGAGADGPFRMPVQLAIRPDASFRGYAGTVAAGRIAPGDPVLLLPSGRRTTVARLLDAGADCAEAGAGAAVTLTFADEVECGRGELLCAPDDPPAVSDQFEATLIWMAEEEMLPGRQYWLKLGTRTVAATVQAPKYEIDVDTMGHLAARTLGLNAIGVVHLWTDAPLPFEPYEKSRTLGGFILIDRITHATVAAGLIHFALRRATNVHWQTLDVTRAARAAIKHQRPRVLWFTGLSGAGKSTIANLVEKRLHALDRHSFLLDGDNLRLGLNRDLGFTDADRSENIRRVGEVARLMADAGLIVLVAVISPFAAERRAVRERMAPGEFVEIFVDTPLDEAERRDVKGLYAKARAGQLANFTGVDSPYEPPEAPELRIDTTRTTPEEAAEAIVDYLLKLEA